MFSFSRTLAWLGLVLGIFNFNAFASPEGDYADAYEKAKAGNQVLWIFVSKGPQYQAQEQRLRQRMKAGVVVTIPPTTKASGQTMKEYLEMTEADLSGGKLALVDFRNPRLEVYGGIVGQLGALSQRNDGDLNNLYDQAIFGLSSIEQEMIEAADAYRARFGRGPLLVSTSLMRAARDYADDHIMDHPHASRVARRHGFPGRVTENLARGGMSGRRVIEYWGEPGVGHEMQQRGLISVNGRWIDGGFTHMGVGNHGDNWIIYFGSSYGQ